MLAEHPPEQAVASAGDAVVDVTKSAIETGLSAGGEAKDRNSSRGCK
jgi:hypothetical protein